jgi:16S rRNA (guanine(527)-N(7))-methyltransferase RsmG
MFHVERSPFRSTWNTPNLLSNTSMIRDESTAARSLIVRGLEELALAVDPGQIDTLLDLAGLLFNWSKRINLTGHRTEVDIVQKLILDAAALTANLPEMDSLADIGSGAGFPGIPVAILRPECRVTLIESRERRHHFQRHVIRQLRLDQVSAVLGRAETLEPSTHAGAIAQAVARPADALPLLLPWVEDGGWLLFPGSTPAPPIPVEDPRLGFESTLEYRVPLGGVARTLSLARKRSESAP